MIKLGTEVKDKITGISGTATARAEHLYGCFRILIECKRNKEGKMEEWWFDEPRLEGKKPEKLKKTGGPKSMLK